MGSFLLNIVRVLLQNPLAQLVAVLHDHQHPLLPDKLLYHCVQQLLHLLSLLHR